MIEGQKGRNASRNLIFSLTRFFISARPGCANTERFPNAGGPNSILPWNQPTTLPDDNSSAAVFIIFSSFVYLRFAASIAARPTDAEYSGPKYKLVSGFTRLPVSSV